MASSHDRAFMPASYKLVHIHTQLIQSFENIDENRTPRFCWLRTYVVRASFEVQEIRLLCHVCIATDHVDPRQDPLERICHGYLLLIALLNRCGMQWCGSREKRRRNQQRIVCECNVHLAGSATAPPGRDILLSIIITNL